MTPSIEIGSSFSHYRVLAELGKGRKGTVFRAEDILLGRTVALRFLPSGVTGEQLDRVLTDVRAAVALDHPNICTIHDVGEHDGHTYVVLGFVEGEPLESRVAEGALPTDAALELAIQVARGLEAAHAKGVAHGILTPTNVMITAEGQVKLMDFGLARLGGETSMPDLETAVRDDIRSLGALFDELTTREALLSEPPSQYESVSEIRAELEAHRDRSQIAVTGDMVTRELGRQLRRPGVLIPAVAVLIVVVGIVGWYLNRRFKVRWARSTAIPEIERLADSDAFLAAYLLAEQVERLVPDDERLLDLWSIVSRSVSLETDPPGADVYVKDYETDDGQWKHIGATPLEEARVPFGFYRWRIEKDGFRTIEVAEDTAGVANQGFSAVARKDGVVQLNPIDQDPPGMIRLPSALFQFQWKVELGEYLIDKYEVTNREYKEFVDAGGYRNSNYWKQPFIHDGKEMSLDEAMSRFVGRLGRSGPAGWEMGAYAEGEDELPVRGVSWYEAAAYAEWAGKSLPTAVHWFRGWMGPNRSAGNNYHFIVRRSNIGGAEQGPVAVGTYQGLTFAGTYDMAGNVKEWCWNAKGAGRAMMGGAWHEPGYILMNVDSQDPFDRDESFGFRCAKYLAADGPAPASLADIPAGEEAPPDYGKCEPVSDEMFSIYRRVYAYDRTEPQAVVEAREDVSRFYWREKVRFDSPIAGERMLVYIHLPKMGRPPYQTVMLIPGGGIRQYSSIDQLKSAAERTTVFARSGRAVVLPVEHGQLERRGTGKPCASELDHWIHISREFSATIDYLETREDIDIDRLGYHGQSSGARIAPILLTLDNRIKAAIIAGGGFEWFDIPDHTENPEFSLFNFLPRFEVPVLMVSGSLDPIFPLETNQKPFFRLIGTPAEHKRLAVLETVHIPPLRADYIREQLDWLDKYLGPVQ